MAQPQATHTSEQRDFYDIALAWSAVVQAASALTVALLTGILLAYSHRAWKAAKRAADAAQESVSTMQTVAQSQTEDMRNSIAQATRAAAAMEHIATSMAQNVEFIKQSLALTGQIVASNQNAAQAASEEANATLAAARAAEKSASIAEQALMLTQRAFIEVGEWTIENLAVNATPTVRYKIINTGPTRATILYVCTNAALGDSLDDPPSYDREARSGPFAVDSRRELRQVETFHQPLTAEQMGKLKSGVEFIFYYGHVVYADVFKAQHRTNFGVKYVATYGPQGSFAKLDGAVFQEAD